MKSGVWAVPRDPRSGPRPGCDAPTPWQEVQPSSVLAKIKAPRCASPEARTVFRNSWRAGPLASRSVRVLLPAVRPSTCPNTGASSGTWRPAWARKPARARADSGWGGTFWRAVARAPEPPGCRKIGVITVSIAAVLASRAKTSAAKRQAAPRSRGASDAAATVLRTVGASELAARRIRAVCSGLGKRPRPAMAPARTASGDSWDSRRRTTSDSNERICQRPISRAAAP